MEFEFEFDTYFDMMSDIMNDYFSDSSDEPYLWQEELEEEEEEYDWDYEYQSWREFQDYCLGFNFQAESTSTNVLVPPGSNQYICTSSFCVQTSIFVQKFFKKTYKNS